MARELDYTTVVEDLHGARSGFPCCGDDGRDFAKHYMVPDGDFDPDYSMVECLSCGAVLTVGDYWGHDVLDADRERAAAPYKSHDENARNSPSRHRTSGGE
jgi:hypothetical protein